MVNENLDTTNKLINPGDISPSDDDIIRQLSDNLQDITTEDVDAMCDEMNNAEKEEVEKKWEIPQELKDFRETWIEKIENIGDESKEKIIKAAETIPVNVETESDGSRLIEFKLGSKKWKILDSKLDSHTDQSIDYVYHADSYSITNCRRKKFRFRGMRCDNVDNWENKKIADYVKEKQQEGLHIPSQNEMGKLLAELGNQINSNNLFDQIAMLMYLTGMDGVYWLSTRDSTFRYLLKCNGVERGIYNADTTGHASLCLIACERGDSGQDITTEKIEPIIENKKFKSIGVIAGMSVMYDEKNRIVEFAGETFDLNPFEGKMSFMSKVSQYADLFRDENVRKVMLTLNI